MQFTKSQTKAIEALKNFLRDDESVICLSGSPGTGKSFLIKEAIPKLVRETNYELVTTATTNKASSLLKDGITIFKAYGVTVYGDENDGDIKMNFKNLKDLRNSVVIIDEVSMLDYRLWAIILDHSHNCKFILVGDKNQLPAIKGDADVFNKYPVLELKEVVRQKDPDFLALIEKAKEGVENKELITIESSNCVHFIDSREDVDNLLKDFGPQDKILAYTNDKVIEYNNHLRQLNDKPKSFVKGDICISRSFVPHRFEAIRVEEQLIVSKVYKPREIIVCGITLPVCDIEFEGKEDTYVISLDHKKLKKITELLASKKLWRDFYSIKEGIVDLRFNNACTVHCSQGSTYNRVLIDYNDLMVCRNNRPKLVYVALSRAKNDVYIYRS